MLKITILLWQVLFEFSASNGVYYLEEQGYKILALFEKLSSNFYAISSEKNNFIKTID